MFLLLLIALLVVAAATGVLWGILQIAAGVALGLFFAVILLAVAGYLLVRHRVRRLQRDLWHDLDRR